MVYAMRTVPPGFHLSALQESDQVVRQPLRGLLDGDFPDDAWAQAQLGDCDCGSKAPINVVGCTIASAHEKCSQG
eukprot:1021127-Amphidinium_carterae.1